MGLFVGIAVVLIIFFSSSTIEKRLKTIESQNKDILKVLEKIKGENKPF